MPKNGFQGQHRWKVSANIRINGEGIQQVEEFKYLGVAFNAKLSLGLCADQQKVKMSRAYYAFKQKSLSCQRTGRFKLLNKFSDNGGKRRKLRSRISERKLKHR